MQYAEVIVFLSAGDVDKTFTYAVPEDMTVSPGDMVLVPFGKRTLEGFVIKVKNEAGFDESKIRPISKKRDESHSIYPEMIDLAFWMQKKYNCYFADAFRLMIPSEMRDQRVKEKTIRIAGLAMDAEEARALLKRAPKQLEVVEALKNGAKPTAYLSEIIPGAGAAIASLHEKGIIEITDDRVRRAPSIDDNGRAHEDPPLMQGQQAAADELVHALDHGGGRFLLHGVTGSGKTEVYIRLIREIFKRDKGAIVLVPEIALTPQMVGWFHARFGKSAAVIHSRLSQGERYDEWERIRSGEARVVIGARSAVFAPVRNLGAIIIDEEHEGAYSSEKRPRYDAREVAWQRTLMAKAVLLLGSATPSIQSYMRVMPGVRPENRLTLLELNKRVMGRNLPECEIVDMRREFEMGNKGIFSGKLVSEMKKCLANGKQAMLFINRRGHSTFVSCRACGHVEKCSECDVSMTYHQSDGNMHCHYCGKSLRPPVKCPNCGSKFIKFFGAGTQKVEEEAKTLFPGVSVGRMDVDTTQGKDGHAKILDAFRKGETKILVGTQMIAKGLDFPNVTLVGVIAADTTLNLPDYRSAERTFQLLTQVAGRAGRSDSPGKVVVQTYTPDHYALECAVKQDYRAFYHTEASYRKHALYPPYTVISRLVISSRDVKAPEEAAEKIQDRINITLTNNDWHSDVLAVQAAPAPIKMLRGEYRWQVYVKMLARGRVDEITAMMEQIAESGMDKVRIELEVNPASMI
ncbi:MAG: primosomal protein N' [Clostridia bacterium]|nr:primosomal protein N' [Clostridia bacterium]